MVDAQYEVIKDTYPKWAQQVEFLAKCELDERHMSTLWGMADALRLTGLCGEASEFVMEAIRRAKEVQANAKA